MKPLAYALIVISLVLTALSLKLSRDDSAAQVDVANLTRNLAVAQQSAKLANERIKVLEGQLAQLETPATPAADGAAAPDATPAPKKSPMAAIADMMKNPAMRDMIATQQKHAAELKYADLFKHFNLSPDEQAQFVALLTEKEAPMMDLGLKALSGNISPDERTALAQQAKDAQAAADEKIRAFINNDADYAYYQNYTKLQPYRSQVDSLNATMLKSGAPLDPTQADSLANLIYQTSKNFPKDPTDNPAADPAAALSEQNVTASLDRQAQIQAQVLQQAAAFLSPDQLDLLKQNQTQQLELQKQSAAMARSMFGGK
jgi:hypothetical protein